MASKKLYVLSVQTESGDKHFERWLDEQCLDDTDLNDPTTPELP